MLLPLNNTLSPLGYQPGTGGLIVHPILDFLQAYWPMTETSGTRSDVHNGHNLSEVGGTVGSTTGIINSAAANTIGSGSGGYLAASNHADLSLAGDFALWFWMRPGAGGGNAAVFCKAYGSDLLLYASTFYAQLLSYHGTGGEEVLNHYSAIDGSWNFVYIDYTAETKVYRESVNNSALNAYTQTTANSVNTNTFALLGDNRGLGNSRMFGAMQYAGKASSPVASADRTWLYNSGTPRTYAEIQAYTG